MAVVSDSLSPDPPAAALTASAVVREALSSSDVIVAGRIELAAIAVQIWDGGWRVAGGDGRWRMVGGGWPGGGNNWWELNDGGGWWVVGGGWWVVDVSGGGC